MRSGVAAAVQAVVCALGAALVGQERGLEVAVVLFGLKVTE